MLYLDQNQDSSSPHLLELDWYSFLILISGSHFHKMTNMTKSLGTIYWCTLTSSAGCCIFTNTRTSVPSIFWGWIVTASGSWLLTIISTRWPRSPTFTGTIYWCTKTSSSWCCILTRTRTSVPSICWSWIGTASESWFHTIASTRWPRWPMSPWTIFVYTNSLNIQCDH